MCNQVLSILCDSCICKWWIEQSENSLHPVCMCLEESFYNKCVQLHGCVASYVYADSCDGWEFSVCVFGWMDHFTITVCNCTDVWWELSILCVCNSSCVRMCLDGLSHNKCEQLHGCVVGAFHPMCMPIVVFCKRWIEQNENSLHPVCVCVWMDRSFNNKCVQLHGCVVGALHPMCMPIVVFVS